VLEVANVEEPRTGLEAKFSLRGLTAMALLGDDTADPAAYNDQRMASPDLVAMRDRVRVSAGKVRTAEGTVRLRTTDGRELVASVDASVPSANLGQQGERLRKKFDVLAGPIVGNDRAGAIAEMIGRLDELQRVTELTRACAA
jgi:2-methylcitrate dehydratase PrpD